MNEGDAVQDLADETHEVPEGPPPIDVAAAFDATAPVDEHAPDGGNHPDAAPVPPEPEPFVCQTAFLCYLNEDGHWVADEKLLNRPLLMAREANWNDYRHATADIAADLICQDTAQRSTSYIMQAQQAAMQQAMQQAQAQKIREGIGVPGGGVDLATLQRMAAQGGQGRP